MKQTYYKSIFFHCLDFEQAFSSADVLLSFQPDIQLQVQPCKECNEGYWVSDTELSPVEKCPEYIRSEEDFDSYFSKAK